MQVYAVSDFDGVGTVGLAAVTGVVTTDTSGIPLHVRVATVEWDPAPAPEALDMSAVAATFLHSSLREHIRGIVVTPGVRIALHVTATPGLRDILGFTPSPAIHEGLRLLETPPTGGKL